MKELERSGRAQTERKARGKAGWAQSARPGPHWLRGVGCRMKGFCHLPHHSPLPRRMDLPKAASSRELGDPDSRGSGLEHSENSPTGTAAASPGSHPPGWPVCWTKSILPQLIGGRGRIRTPACLCCGCSLEGPHRTLSSIPGFSCKAAGLPSPAPGQIPILLQGPVRNPLGVPYELRLKGQGTRAG